VTPPSCLAIWLAERPSCQSFLRSSTRSSVQPIFASRPFCDPARAPLRASGSTSCGAQQSRCSPTTISSKQLLKSHNRRPGFRPQELDVASAGRTLAAGGRAAHMGSMKDMSLDEAVLPPPARDYPGVNWEGLKTLYVREVRRFIKVGMQTLAAPVVTALLYMLVFVVAVGGGRQVHGVDYGAFVAPGLVMMQILSNAFANSSSSLLQAKFNGLMGDFMTPPLSPAEHTVGFGAGAATRGIFVGVISLAAVL